MKILAAGLASVSLAVGAPLASAGGASEHSSRALQASAEAVGNALVAGVKLVSGVLAVPLGVSGQIGTASGELSDALWEEANTPYGEALPVDDDLVTAGPAPGEALRRRPPTDRPADRPVHRPAHRRGDRPGDPEIE